MNFAETSLSQFTDALASDSAVPGGGGASALCGALAAALGSMVGELTRHGGKADDSVLLPLIDRAGELRVELLECIERDAVAFEPLSRAYRIPKTDPDRPKIMEDCLRTAAGAPFEILELCCKTAVLLIEFADKGAKMALSDVATAAAFCRGAIQGAAINVKVNTKLMHDREYADGLNARVEALLDEHLPITDRIFADIYGRYE